MASRKEVKERIYEVQKMLLSGMQPGEIFRKSAELWGIQERQTRNYMDTCYAKWEKYFSSKEGKQLEYQKAKRADLYNKAYKEGNWKLCLEIAQDETKLTGTYPAEKHEHDIVASFIIEKVDYTKGALNDPNPDPETN